MGTNYYLVPKDFDLLDNINERLDIILRDTKNEYKETIRRLIDKVNNKHSIYKEVLEFPSLEDFDIKFEWKMEVPDIHICKISGGWCPSFESNKYYSNFDEFKDFYNKYKDDFDIKDEYNKSITLDELESIATTAEENAKEFHSKYNSCGIAYYTTDNYGFEWTNTHFS